MDAPSPKPAPAPTVERTCRRDRVRDLIVTRILDGTYPPGTHLKEMALATELEVSQAPVREALRELEMLGLVESERYCGTRVLALDEADLLEAYELRALIGERSSQLAVPCAPAALDPLRVLVDRMRTAAADGDFSSYGDAAASFHRRVVELSGNRQFLRAWDALHWNVWSRIASRKVVRDLPMFAEQHQVILDALLAQDGKRAGRLLRRMIDQFIARSTAD